MSDAWLVVVFFFPLGSAYASAVRHISWYSEAGLQSSAVDVLGVGTKELIGRRWECRG